MIVRDEPLGRSMSDKLTGNEGGFGRAERCPFKTGEYWLQLQDMCRWLSQFEIDMRANQDITGIEGERIRR
jgi:hypothetical protein